jgi:hypothetical protein
MLRYAFYDQRKVGVQTEARNFVERVRLRSDVGRQCAPSWC